MSPPLIETRGLSKHFGGVQAVRDMTSRWLRASCVA